MKNTNRGILLGTVLLGAASASFVAPAQAKPRQEVREERREVKEARKDVKQQRKDVRHADSAADRRREQQDVREARENLQREQRQLRNTHNSNSSYNRNHPVYNRNHPNYNQNHPNYNGTYANRTLVGVVSNDVRGNAFTLRLSNGQRVRADVRYGEPHRLSAGDRVRVSGFTTNGIFHADRLTILNNR